MITVVINTRNEQSNIVECIRSAKLLTNDVLVVDMHSTDQTVALAKSENAEVALFDYSGYVEPARLFGIKQAKSQWVFILDADERMTKELALEIQQLLESPPKTTNDQNLITHYRIARKNIFGDTKWLSHGGWYPDYQTRLINKDKLVDWPARIHSTPSIEGNKGHLNNPFIHYFHGNITQMVNKTIKFENVESDLLFDAGRKVNTLTFFRKNLAELFRRLIAQQGYLDGMIGWIESIYQAYSKTITYLFLFEKTNAKRKK